MILRTPCLANATLWNMCMILRRPRAFPCIMPSGQSQVMQSEVEPHAPSSNSLVERSIERLCDREACSSSESEPFWSSEARWSGDSERQCGTEARTSGDSECGSEARSSDDFERFCGLETRRSDDFGRLCIQRRGLHGTCERPSGHRVANAPEEVKVPESIQGV